MTAADPDLRCACGHLVMIHASGSGNGHWRGCFVCGCFREGALSSQEARDGVTGTGATAEAVTGDLASTGP